jgi:transposase-like protein
MRCGCISAFASVIAMSKSCCAPGESSSRTYEAIRRWCLKFGQDFANQLQHRRPRPGDEWHLDEVFLTIHGERHYLWRAVDQDGHVLDILV